MGLDFQFYHSNAKKGQCEAQRLFTRKATDIRAGDRLRFSA
jgi:hypothetical protein